MIVGHNPSLSDLVGLFGFLGEVGKMPFYLKKGSIAALSAATRTGSLFQLDWAAPAGLLQRLCKRK